MNTDLDTIRTALTSIRDQWTEKRYCAGDYAQDAHGKNTRPCTEDAVRWCVIGMCKKVTNGYPYEVIGWLNHTLDDSAQRTHRGMALVEFNDTQGWRACHELVQRALARTQG